MAGALTACCSCISTFHGCTGFGAMLHSSLPTASLPGACHVSKNKWRALFCVHITCQPPRCDSACSDHSAHHREHRACLAAARGEGQAGCLEPEQGGQQDVGRHQGVLGVCEGKREGYKGLEWGLVGQPWLKKRERQAGGWQSILEQNAGHSGRLHA